MVTIRDLVAERLRAALRTVAPDAAEGATIEVARPQLAEHGDFSTNLALQLASRLKQPPRQIAEALVAALGAAPGDELLSRAETAGPGFVNVWLTPSRVEQAVDEIRDNPETYGTAQAAKPERINVEF